MIYVVDKRRNDAWLTDLDSGHEHVKTYRRRPWARSFRTESSAISYADSLPNKDNVEIELEDGSVLGWQDDRWQVVFI